MTVCIAAICEKGDAIVLVTDNMMVSNLRAGTIQSKIVPITRPVSVLLAGDLHLQSEIVEKVRQVFGEYEATAEPYRHTTKSVAQAFQKAYQDIRQERIENEILRFYGIEPVDWRTDHQSLDSHLIDTIVTEIQDYQLPNVGTIVAGVDKTQHGTRAHIRILINDKLINRDLIGYACIGDGGAAAEAELIRRNCAANMSATTAAQVALDAKVQAEAVNTVGPGHTLGFILNDESELFRSGILTNAEFKKLLTDNMLRRRNAPYLEDLRSQVSLLSFSLKKRKEALLRRSTADIIDSSTKS